MTLRVFHVCLILDTLLLTARIFVKEISRRLSKKQKLCWNADSHLKWYGFYTGMTVICFLLVSLASPKEITSAAIVNAVRSGEARAYADAIEQNIETIKNSDEDLILIQEPPKTPDLFTTDEIETWRFGTAEYYGKNKIRYYGEE